jgi:hypothetical protein
MMRLKTLVVSAAFSGLAACGGPSAPSATSLTAGGELRAESFCAVEGLTPSQRHTLIMIDENALSKTENPADFVALNGKVRDVVLTFADPDRALSSGASDYRERISIHILPNDGAASYRVFSGCVPGLSPQELADAKKESSAVGDFFSGGVSQKIENDVADFTTKLIGALQVGARGAKGPAKPQTGPVADISVFQSLRSSGRVINSDAGLPRLVVVTDLSGVDLPEATTREELRKAGFTAGDTSALDFGRADVIFVQGSGGNEQQREFVDAFLLAQHGKLVYWGNERVGALPPAPSRLARYVGKVIYPNGEDTVQIRLASDRNGKLVNSWMILRGRPDKSVPLSGTALCSEAGQCEVRSDEGGFSQAWSIAPGGDPEFDPDMPFSGMRDFEFIADTRKLSGKLFDPSVDRIGPPGSETDSIKLEAQVQADATF